MFKKILKKTAMYSLIAFVAYLEIGYLLHAVIFPEKKPDISTYFKPGDVFYSKTERIKQTVVKQENGFVYCSASIEPFAPGPPEHVHTGFDETFEISNGELSLLVNGEVKKLRPGQKLHIPKGTPHKPYNETADTIYTTNLVAFPEKFAFHLVQVYGLMDNEGLGKSKSPLLQMSLMNREGFDSYMAGIPVPMQKTLGFILTPATRLLGYKSFYPAYDIKRRI
ncbi:MAG TPA: cupin domain-containing protein [Ferruginibacter sp.]|nr:cupin domain-containing protein [Ferruginibacter sp.]